jgi:hypothetical protein
MLKQVLKVVLLVALLSAFLTSGSAAFGQKTKSASCQCYDQGCILGKPCKKATGSCKLDASLPGTFQCVSNNCSTYCVEFIQ